MKKLLYLIAAIPFVACNTSSYKINGTTENVADSTIVFLQVLKSDKTLQNLDTAYVVNNKFKFSGSWKDAPSNAQLVFKESLFTPKFILEKGTINIVVENQSKKRYNLSGTESNETFISLYKNNQDLSNQLIEITNGLKNNNTPEEFNKIYEEAAIIQTQLNNTYVGYAIENPNQDLSALLIEQLYFSNSLDTETLEKFKNYISKDSQYYNKIAAYTSGRVLSTQIGQNFEIDPFTKLANSPHEYKSAFADKTIVYFWSNYDQKNEENFHALQLMYNKYKGEIPVITINIGRNQEKYKEFIKNHHQFINFNIPQTDSADLKELLKKYQLKFLPQGILTDKNGKILDMDPTMDYILEPLNQKI